MAASTTPATPRTPVTIAATRCGSNDVLASRVSVVTDGRGNSGSIEATAASMMLVAATVSPLTRTNSVRLASHRCACGRYTNGVCGSLMVEYFESEATPTIVTGVVPDR